MTQEPEEAEDSPSSKPPLSKEEIVTAAEDLNAASDELQRSINAIEAFLAKRNFGVPAWVVVKSWHDQEDRYWSRELGYDRFGHSWHLGIRETSGIADQFEYESKMLWTFHEAPRKARIAASDKIPELLHELVKESARTARKLRDKAKDVHAFAATLAPPPAAKLPKKVSR